MKLWSRDFQCFKMIPSIIYFFLKPGTLNNCETMAQRGLLRGGREEKPALPTLPALEEPFQSRNGSLCRKACSPVFRSPDISINTSQMNLKHHVLLCISRRMEVPTLATPLKSSNYRKKYIQ